MSTGHRMDRVEYAPEVLKLVLDDMVPRPACGRCSMPVAARRGPRRQPHRRSQDADEGRHRRAATPAARRRDRGHGCDAARRRRVPRAGRRRGAAAGDDDVPLRTDRLRPPRRRSRRPNSPRWHGAATSRAHLARAALHASRDPYSQRRLVQHQPTRRRRTDPLALGTGRDRRPTPGMARRRIPAPRRSRAAPPDG